MYIETSSFTTANKKGCGKAALPALKVPNTCDGTLYKAEKL